MKTMMVIHHISLSNIREGLEEEFENTAFVDAVMEKIMKKIIISFPDDIVELLRQQSDVMIEKERILKIIRNIKRISLEWECFSVER